MRIAVTAAALALLAAGGALLFAPGLLGLDTPPAQAVAALYAAALIGLGLASWVARASPLGGIYGRALVVGNFAHALVGALALLRPVVGARLAGGTWWGALALYAALAVGWGLLLFELGRERGEA